MSKKVVIKQYEVIDLVIDYRAREWCLLPYPNHPKGCPNYNQKATCPPQAPLIEDFIYLDKPMWLIVIEFDLKNHAEKMKQRPRKNGKPWTEAQARCNLYWQGSIRKKLKESCIKFCQSKNIGFNKDFIEQALVPEATGLHIIRSAKKVGIPIKSRPKDTVFKMALIGYSKKIKRIPINLESYF